MLIDRATRSQSGQHSRPWAGEFDGAGHLITDSTDGSSQFTNQSTGDRMGTLMVASVAMFPLIASDGTAIAYGVGTALPGAPELRVHSWDGAARPHARRHRRPASAPAVLTDGAWLAYARTTLPSSSIWRTRRMASRSCHAQGSARARGERNPTTRFLTWLFFRTRADGAIPSMIWVVIGRAVRRGPLAPIEAFLLSATRGAAEHQRLRLLPVPVDLSGQRRDVTILHRPQVLPP